MKFEYLDVTEKVAAGGQEALLNKYGADGWELVHYNPDTRVVHSMATMHAVFKRDCEAQAKHEDDLRFAEAQRHAHAKKNGLPNVRK